MLSKMIVGRRGSDFDKAAYPAMREALCDNAHGDCGCYSCRLALSSHPDVMMMDQTSYLVEDIEELIRFARSSPMIASTRCAYVKNFMGITEQSQNKLLKELEDNKTFLLIATAIEGEGYILPTIYSRVVKCFAVKESKQEFSKHFANKGVNGEEISLLYHMSGGFILLAEEMQGQAHIYQSVKEAILQLNKKDLFSALSLVADKDAGNYFDTYKGYLQQLFSFMAAVVVERYVEDGVFLLETINNEKTKALGNWYGKTDFFTSISVIAEGFSFLKKEDDYE